jgi:hypothetical protein
MKTIFITIGLSLLTPILLKSQSVLPAVLSSSGDFYSNASGMVQWTLGETMVETYNTSGHFITQGFHQPDVLATAAPTYQMSNEQIGLYPNPATDHITLEFGQNSEGNYQIDIYNSLGQIVKTQQYSSTNFSRLEISLDGLANGAYFVRMNKKDSTEIKSFHFNKAS